MEKHIHTPFSDTIMCRRTHKQDRRKAHFKATLLSFFQRRRTEVRRNRAFLIEDVLTQSQAFSKWSLTLLILFVAFDAILGLTLIAMGNSVNDTLELLLSNQAILHFFLLKSGIAAACIILAATYQSLDRFRLIPAQHLLYGFIGAYLALLFYQINIL